MREHFSLYRKVLQRIPSDDRLSTHFEHGELALSGADRAGLTVLPLVPLCFRDLGIITRDPKFLSEAAKQMLQAFTDYVQ